MLTKPMTLAPRAYLRPPLLDGTSALLAGGPSSVIAYAFTSTSYLGGDGDDDTLRERLEAYARPTDRHHLRGPAGDALRGWTWTGLPALTPPGSRRAECNGCPTTSVV